MSSVIDLSRLGPTLPISEELHQTKYRQPEESFVQSMRRLASTLSESAHEEARMFDMFAHQRFLAAGRVQSAVGAKRQVTPLNCYVSGTIEDNSESIMERAKEAFQTMRLGGGIGYCFSNIRPRNSLIKTLDSQASGPVSFMGIYDAVCATVSSAGHRRGAQMGVLRCDHPDIEEFLDAKQNTHRLLHFNISIGVTDAFMEAIAKGTSFPLTFEGEIYKWVDARELWDKIMLSTWDWAEPGVLFIDTINKNNNLYYCETISATNPCGEQPLPAYGACLLGSLNAVKYVTSQNTFDYRLFIQDVELAVRALDRVHDVAIYPLSEQRDEGHAKRRMGIGVTGMANAIEYLTKHPYGSPMYIDMQNEILTTLKTYAYLSSSKLASERGAFPMFDKEKYLDATFVRSLPRYVRDAIATNGIRNSHLTSIAPTGTISLTADNVSGGIEPVFSYSFDRTINMPDGVRTETVEDYGVRVFNHKGRRADECSVDDHVNVFLSASKHVDSAVSKTCNIGPNVSFEDFKAVYMKAYQGGAKGCATFRADGKRAGILTSKDTPEVENEDEGSACYYDPETGRKSCD
jgi:ribonucleoside-diphosphate reductase alpha chain